MSKAVIPDHATLTALALASMLVTGCSNVRPYPNSYDKNVRVHTKAESGEFFSRVRVDIDIFDLVEPCRVAYRGSMELDRPTIDIGLPINNPSYIEIGFTRNSLGGRSTIAYDTVLSPRPGYFYDAEVNYSDGIYGAVIREGSTVASAKTGREIARKSLQQKCR
jgi:hypothetical protein